MIYKLSSYWGTTIYGNLNCFGVPMAVAHEITVFQGFWRIRGMALFSTENPSDQEYTH